MTEGDWEQRRQHSEGLWREIRIRIEELERGGAEKRPVEDLTEIWRRRALELSRDTNRDRERGDSSKVVVFRLGAERYAVRITTIREIQKVGKITPVSTAPPFVTGVINIRGVILSVLDLGTFFGMEKIEVGESTRILVAEGKEMILGFLVEKVEEIVDIPAREVRPPLSPSKGIVEDYVAGIVALPGGMVVMVDLDKVLRNPRIVVDDVV